jgi:hypothetical protein
MILIDKEFGEVIVRKNAFSTGARFSVSTSGRLSISIPSCRSERYAKKALESCREQIREKLHVKDPATQRARDAQKKILQKTQTQLIQIINERNMIIHNNQILTRNVLLI